LKGKCRSCGSIISKQYIFVELLTGALFSLSGYFWFSKYLVFSEFGIIENLGAQAGIPLSFILVKLATTLVIVSILVVITVYDYRHKIIPDGFVYAFAIIAFAFNSIIFSKTGLVLAWPQMSTIIAGPLLALPFYFLWLFSGGRWMGLGDAKLALGIGWMLGITQGLSALLIAFWLGAICSVFILIIQEVWKGLSKENMFNHKFKLPRLNMKSEIPFAPFLIIGLLISFYLDYNIINVLLNYH
jgi:leader peptidase (prepilin peptidase)/N-methyltransferase